MPARSTSSAPCCSRNIPRPGWWTGSSKPGLVERQICPTDGRGQFIAITPEGRKLQKKMWPTCAAAIERHLGSKLSVDERLQLRGLLEKLLS